MFLSKEGEWEFTETIGNVIRWMNEMGIVELTDEGEPRIGCTAAEGRAMGELMGDDESLDDDNGWRYGAPFLLFFTEP